MPHKIMINQATRKTAQAVLQDILKSTYFSDGVPLDTIADNFKDMGIIMVMEDYTEWSGFLYGSVGKCFIRLAPMSTMKKGTDSFNKGLEFYDPYENTGLRLTWYKCTSRRDSKFEVIGYIT